MGPYDIGFWLALSLGVLFLLAFYAVTLRFGPRRGHWNQPAAALRAPGRKLVLGLYAVGVLHVVVGIFAAAVAADGSVGVLLVALLTGGFYVACGKVMAIASQAPRLRRRKA